MYGFCLRGYVSKTFPRTLNPYTSWNVNDINASVLTGAASVNLKGSDAKNDGNWSYTAETRDITTYEYSNFRGTQTSQYRRLAH